MFPALSLLAFMPFWGGLSSRRLWLSCWLFRSAIVAGALTGRRLCLSPLIFGSALTVGMVIPLTDRKNDRLVITLERKTVYGVELLYPVGWSSRAVPLITNKKTVNDFDIIGLRRLGFSVDLVGSSSDSLAPLPVDSSGAPVGADVV